MATPRAQEAYERFYATLALPDGRKRLVHQRLATHWARLIELLYAAERFVELATDPEITSPRRPHAPDRDAHRRGSASSRRRAAP